MVRFKPVYQARNVPFELKSLIHPVFQLFGFNHQKRRITTLGKYFDKGGSPGLVVMGGDSCSEGCGYKSRCRTLDGHDIFSHRFIVKNCIVCLKRLKRYEREARIGPF